MIVDYSINVSLLDLVALTKKTAYTHLTNAGLIAFAAPVVLHLNALIVSFSWLYSLRLLLEPLPSFCIPLLYTSDPVVRTETSLVETCFLYLLLAASASSAFLFALFL